MKNLKVTTFCNWRKTFLANSVCTLSGSRDVRHWQPAMPVSGVPQNGDRFHGILDVVCRLPRARVTLCPAETYRVTLVVADLGWVDLYFDAPMSARFC